MASKNNEVILSLISHTNVGKTALARTLLREDVGEVADRAHVTVVSEAYTLLEADGRVARLWDTPGFGSNLAKLAKRLRASKNPVGWILHQVWDRLRDESLWCSQEAIRNIQADADVVIYLVDASQSPDTVGYVDLEMEILDWIGKPVLVFLNQVGEPDPDRIRNEEEEWRTHLKDHGVVKSVSTLDAFTRCFIREHLILEKAAESLEGEKGKTARKLTDALVKRNLEVFQQSVDSMASLMAFSLADTEALREKSLLEKLQSFIAFNEKDDEMENIQQKMYERLAERTASTINELISIHGLDGETAQELTQSSKEEFAVRRDVEESLAATVGGAVSGLVGGLSADLLSGGMTFGGGAIVGMVLGGATTYALAKGYNLTQTGNNMVRWTEAQFQSQVEFLSMLFMAVSHFGRGRGLWQDPENNPAHWETAIHEQLEIDKDKWNSLWKKGGASAKVEKLEKALKREMRELLSSALVKIYPDLKDVF